MRILRYFCSHILYGNTFLTYSNTLSLSLDTEFNTSQSDEVFLDDDMGAPPPDTTNATSSAATRKKDSERSVSFGAYPSIQVTEEEEVECASLVSSLAVSFSLPQHSRGLGIQEKYSKRQSSDRVLIFHGIILRSQLVTLLEHKIFFKEEDGVSSGALLWFSQFCLLFV